MSGVFSHSQWDINFKVTWDSMQRSLLDWRLMRVHRGQESRCLLLLSVVQIRRTPPWDKGREGRSYLFLLQVHEYRLNISPSLSTACNYGIKQARRLILHPRILLIRILLRALATVCCSRVIRIFLFGRQAVSTEGYSLFALAKEIVQEQRLGDTGWGSTTLTFLIRWRLVFEV